MRIAAGRILGWTITGAACSAVVPFVAYRYDGVARVEFVDSVPRPLLSGLYPAELTSDGLSFAWSGASFSLRLPALDRAIGWRVTARIAGSRADGTTPELHAAVDGRPVLRERLPATGFVDTAVDIAAAPEAGRGAIVDFQVVPTFVPGGDDTRALGVQVDWIELRPGGRPWWHGDAGALAALAALGAVTGALTGALALSWRAGAGLVLAGGVAIGVLGVHDLGSLMERTTWPAMTAGLASAGLAWLCLRRSAAGRVVVVLTWLSAALEMFALGHPSMKIGDALFHAHRFQEVLAGQWLFTSITPGEYRFPYAVGLYVAAAPLAAWAPTALDKMLLLRLVVVVANAASAALLFRIVTFWRPQPLAGVASVVAFHLLPLGFDVITTGNLTNAFGQSLAIGALALASAPRLGPGLAAALSAVAAASFLSHASTLVMLGSQLAVLGVLLTVSHQPARRRAGQLMLGATVVAGLAALVLYYRHFLDVYREAWTRVMEETGRATAAAGGRTPWTRLVETPERLLAYYGLPILGFAIAGAIRLGGRSVPGDDRLRATAATWALVCLGFLAVGIVTPMDFRHALAALPALAILAGLAWAEAWSAGGMLRGVAVAGAAWAGWLTAHDWFRL